jgi:hypothetical protein
MSLATFSFLQYLRLVQDSRFLFRNYKIAVQLNLASKAHELNLLGFQPVQATIV